MISEIYIDLALRSEILHTVSIPDISIAARGRDLAIGKALSPQAVIAQYFYVCHILFVPENSF